MIRREGLQPSTADSIQREIDKYKRLPEYTVATVPPAADHVREWAYISDETGGAVPAFSDGTNWRRVTDRAVIS